GLNFPAIQGSRILAMTHAAIHDAVNAIDRRYKPYAMDRLAEPGASPEAAVAAAAHDVLAAQLPTQKATLDAAYASSLAGISDGARDAISFTTTSGAPNPAITRSFTSFSQAAQENANSRVYAGIHFRSACRDGLIQGTRVGRYVFEHALRPAFDICLKDDVSGDILRIDTAGGDYQFLRCGGNGVTIVGGG